MCTLEIVLTLHTLHRGSRRVTYGTLTLPTTPTHAYVVNGKPAGRLGQKPSASLDVIVDRCMAVINIFCSRAMAMPPKEEVSCIQQRQQHEHDLKH